jgi:hypothetical protein
MREIAGGSMAQDTHKLTFADIGHILNRMVLALLIGWGYLAAVIVLDVGGWGTWLHTSKFGPLIEAQLIAVMGVAFGAVGAHIGLCNVMQHSVRRQRAKIAERREAMRRWERD